MRRIVAVVLLLVPLLAAAVWAVYLADTLAGPVTALEDAGLVGPVHQVVERTYIIEPDDELLREDSISDKTMKTFDRNGNVTESIVYGPNDLVAKKTTFEYDENGYFSEMVIYFPDGNAKGRSVGEYDAEKNVSFIKVYAANGVFHHSGEMIYDDRGFVAETRTLTVDGELVERIVYIVDAAGRQVGENRYDASGLTEKIVRKFAANGEVTRIESYYPNGTRWHCSEWAHELLYDDVANWLRRETTDIDCLEGRSQTEFMTVAIRDITYHK